MEIAVDLMVFALGLIAGVGAMMLRTKLSSDNQQTKNLLNQCQQQNAQLQQLWQDHIAEYRSIATNLEEMSGHIHRQIEDAEAVLAPEQQGPSFPFFSKEATQILTNANRKKRIKAEVSDQPLDYSGKASGVFQGQAAVETNKDS